MIAVKSILGLFLASLSSTSASMETVTAGTYYDVSGEGTKVPSLEQLMVLNECEARYNCIHVVKLKKSGELKKVSSTKELEELERNGEVAEVYSKPPSQKVVNVALKKDTKAFPVSRLSSSSNVVDGKRDGPCFFTSTEDQLPWWRVAFGRTVFVHLVSMTCYLRDFDIRVGYQDKNGVNPYCRRNMSISTEATKDFQCENNAVGTFLFIEKESPVMYICEVEVHGIYTN